MNPDLYTKSVERLLVDGKISLAHVPSIIGPNAKEEYMEWRASVYQPKLVSGEGMTPRDAIIDLYKNLQ